MREKREDGEMGDESWRRLSILSFWRRWEMAEGDGADDWEARFVSIDRPERGVSTKGSEMTCVSLWIAVVGPPARRVEGSMVTVSTVLCLRGVCVPGVAMGVDSSLGRPPGLEGVT